MNKLLTAFALASVLLSGAAQARDYMDKTSTICDKDAIQTEIATLWENGPRGKQGIRVVYIKDNAVEIGRFPTDLRCRVTVVSNRGNVQGVFRWFKEDGHSLVSFQPGKTK